MKKNFFNVLIPTRNRLETLKYSLATALNQDYDNYQVIISDNNSSDGTGAYINSLNSPKIHCYNTGNSISMSSNFEFGISKITEGFIIVIGDDDGLLPNALNHINDLINKYKVLAISSKKISYYWPNSEPYQNLLLIPNRSGTNHITMRNSKISLRKILNGDMIYSDLPMLYTGGVVHHSLVQKARSKDGLFFKSSIPDVYSGLAIASVTPYYLSLSKPFSIDGISKYSNGHSQLGCNKNHLIAENFYRENDIPFHHSLGNGKVKSVHLLTLESFIQSQFLRNYKKISNMSKQLEIAAAKAPKEFLNETMDYLKVQCHFHPKPISVSNVRMHLLMVKFTTKNTINRFNKFAFWSTISTVGKVNNVYDAAVYVTKKRFSNIEIISLKIDRIKLKIEKIIGLRI